MVFNLMDFLFFSDESEDFVNTITEHLFSLSVAATPDKLKRVGLLLLIMPFLFSKNIFIPYSRCLDFWPFIYDEFSFFESTE